MFRHCRCFFLFVSAAGPVLDVGEGTDTGPNLNLHLLVVDLRPEENKINCECVGETILHALFVKKTLLLIKV